MSSNAVLIILLYIYCTNSVHFEYKNNLKKNADFSQADIRSVCESGPPTAVGLRPNN